MEGRAHGAVDFGCPLIRSHDLRDERRRGFHRGPVTSTMKGWLEIFSQSRKRCQRKRVRLAESEASRQIGDYAAKWIERDEEPLAWPLNIQGVEGPSAPSA